MRTAHARTESSGRRPGSRLGEPPPRPGHTRGQPPQVPVRSATGCGNETQSEAEDYYHHYGVEMADNEALDRQLAVQKGRTVFEHLGELEKHRMRFAAGGGSYPLVGTPRRITEEMIKMSEAGLAGATLCFVNFKDELPEFIRTVLPLLEEAGLREPA